MLYRGALAGVPIRASVLEFTSSNRKCPGSFHSPSVRPLYQWPLDRALQGSGILSVWHEASLHHERVRSRGLVRSRVCARRPSAEARRGLVETFVRALVALVSEFLKGNCEIERVLHLTIRNRDWA